jgi:hypothetical protein
MAIVEFTKDCYPYCKGDRIELSEEEIKDVDALAEQREVSKPYKVVEDPKVPEAVETVEAPAEPQGERVKPVISQDAADANLSAPGVEATAAVETSGKQKQLPRRKQIADED